MGIIAEASLPTRRMDFENTRLPPEADAPRTRNAVFNGERLKLFFINTWREPDMNPKSMVINSALSVPDVPFVVLEAEKYLTAVTSGCAFQDKPTTRRFAANKFFDFADLRRCGHRTRHDENGCGRQNVLDAFYHSLLVGAVERSALFFGLSSFREKRSSQAFSFALGVMRRENQEAMTFATETIHSMTLAQRGMLGAG